MKKRFCESVFVKAFFCESVFVKAFFTHLPWFVVANKYLLKVNNRNIKHVKQLF